MASYNKSNAVYYPVNSPIVTFRYGVPYRRDFSFTKGAYWGENLCIKCFKTIKEVIQNFKNNSYDANEFLKTDFYTKLKTNCIQKLLIHPAVDIRANESTEIRSVAWGKITKLVDSGTNAFNTFIEIEHKVNCRGNIETFWARYVHLPIDNARRKALKVKNGDTVFPGQVLSVGVHPGANANSSGSHLHFEIHTVANAPTSLWSNFPHIDLISYFLGDEGPFKADAKDYFDKTMLGQEASVGNIFKKTVISDSILQLANIPGEGSNETDNNVRIRNLLIENKEEYIKSSVVDNLNALINNKNKFNVENFNIQRAPLYDGVGFPSFYKNPLSFLSILSGKVFGTAVSNGIPSLASNY